ncbi:RND family efflux transporter, MFP subunit [Paenibacillus sp. 1_12]|uniref:efflux RND transporter periplasmic adaptor subunit n=1 Tax=Paenibacillus sp. 1_12 TaxID=1566278 RepID=UPI0008E976EB|nr:efflux RND transporter periplasmic adaptor subunit [Paenibacillus sp. 1_12]SFL10754.1 RND family efflux transporter, MFP subunit [Paenibacillus sp. 1_12]
MRKKRRKPYRRVLKTVSILALSFTIIAGCSETIPLNHESNTAVQEQPLKSVKVYKVAKQKIGDPVERAADVQSSVQFDIIAKAGGDIEKVLKNREESVQEGEVIVKVNSADAKFEKERAVLAVETIQTSINNSREKARKEMETQKRELNNSILKLEMGLGDMTRNYNKLKNDYEVGLATKAQLYQMDVQLRNAQMDLDQMKQRQRQSVQDSSASLPEMETQLKNAQLSLQQLEQSLSYLEIKSPASGILMGISLEAGMTLQAGSKIGVIQKLDPIRIKALLTADEAKYVSSKTELTYYLPGTTQKYRGKVSFLSKVIDPDTKAYEINLDVPNKEMTLKPGMKVWLQLTEEQDQIVLTIPTYSIVKQGEDSFVYVLAGDSVEKRKVQLGRVNEPDQEVLSGVKEGEQVVISNPNQLRDKEKVQRAAVEVPK